MITLKEYIKKYGYEFDGRRSNKLKSFALDVLELNYPTFQYQMSIGFRNLKYWQVCRILDATGLSFSEYREMIDNPGVRTTPKKQQNKEGEAPESDIEEKYNRAHGKEK